MIAIGYGVILAAFFVYSYFLIDPNITFFQSHYWVQFRDWAVYLGYYRRDISWVIYLVLLILLFIFHKIILKKYQKYSTVRLAGFLVIFGCISYPFLSHDLFNYLFDARIFTHYGLNPYTHTALDFQKDLWTRFMHWTHRSYPYGPTFLPISFIPSYLGLGKFSLTFVFYKLMNGLLYFCAVLLLNKKNKKTALLFATHPLIIIEGLMNGHNDLIAVSLGLIGIYLLEKKYNIWSRVFLLLSVGIKYVTMPILLFFVSFRHSREDGKLDTRLRGYDNPVLIAFLVQIFLILYLCYKMEIQPWYFISLFAFLPFFLQFIEKLDILFFGLLISYYPFIRFGDWTVQKADMKHQIVYVAVFLNILYFVFKYSLKYVSKKR